MRTTGLLAIVSLIGISTAAEQTDNKPAASKNDTQKTTSINLSNGSNEAAQDPNSSTADHTASNTTVVSGKASNTSGTSYNLIVNNQPVDVPTNGSNQQTITSPDGGTTTVTVNNSTSGQGSNFSSTRTTTNVSTRQSSINQDTVIEHDFGSP